MENLFEVSVFSYNGKVPYTRTTHRFYGKEFTLDMASQFGNCDNVEHVEVISGTTGELFLVIEEGKVTWQTSF